jgi:predicted esterase
MSINKSVLVFACIIFFSLSGVANSGSIYESVPGSIDPAKRYLVFLHGNIVEKKGLPASSKRYGKYEYSDMLKRFSSEGFEVISEVRKKDTDILDYSARVAEDVKKLVAAGVPGKNITVSGYSKGGRMALVVSTLLNNREVNYIVLAGCRSSDISAHHLKPVGRVLSIFDSNDDEFESCSEIFSAGGEGLVSNEIILHVGSGHGLFYSPADEWVLPMIEWAKQ